MAACMLYWTCIGESARASKIVFFPCKVAAADDEGQVVLEWRIFPATYCCSGQKRYCQVCKLQMWADHYTMVNLINNPNWHAIDGTHHKHTIPQWFDDWLYNISCLILHMIHMSGFSLGPVDHLRWLVVPSILRAPLAQPSWRVSAATWRHGCCLVSSKDIEIRKGTY